jgi:hypothetical protein
MSGPNALAGFGQAQALLVTNGADFPLQYSQDGGQTWQAVALPAIPGVDPTGEQTPGLQILPDGSLLAHPEGAAWKMLMPGAAAWCGLDKVSLPDSTNDLLAAGGNLWWLNADANGALTPARVPLSALKCGG